MDLCFAGFALCGFTCPCNKRARSIGGWGTCPSASIHIGLCLPLIHLEENFPVKLLIWQQGALARVEKTLPSFPFWGQGSIFTTSLLPDKSSGQSLRSARSHLRPSVRTISAAAGSMSVAIEMVTLTQLPSLNATDVSWVVKFPTALSSPLRTALATAFGT